MQNSDPSVDRSFAMAESLVGHVARTNKWLGMDDQQAITETVLILAYALAYLASESLNAERVLSVAREATDGALAVYRERKQAVH